MPGAGATRRATQEDNDLSELSAAARDLAAPRPPMSMGLDERPGDALLGQILDTLTDEKAEDVVPIGLRGKSEIADWMVVCSGRSTRQVAAIADKLVERLKHECGVLARTEGKDIGDWVLIDAGDVIVHVFRPEVREFYQLEKMWMSPAEAAARA